MRFRAAIYPSILTAALPMLVISLAIAAAFALAEPAPPGRVAYARIQLTDGRVLFAGGAGDNGNPLARATIFNPQSGKFVATGAMIVPRCGPTATILADGTILLAGGVTCAEEPAPVKELEIYDPRAGSFRVAGALKIPRFDLNALLLKNNQVLLAQGYDIARNPVAQAERNAWLDQVDRFLFPK